MRSRTVRWALPVLAVSLLGLLAPNLASAQTPAWVYIDDNGASTQPDTSLIKASLDTAGYSIAGATATGSILGGFAGTSVGFKITQEVETVALINGAVDLNFGYVDLHPLPVGIAKTVNFHITAPWEPLDVLGDTLSINVTGRVPDAADPANTLVDLRFISAAANNQIPRLPNAIVVDGFTTGDFTPFITTETGLTELHVQAWSEQLGPDVPEPASLATLAAISGLALLRRRR